jgi:hypothetical protein
MSGALYVYGLVEDAGAITGASSDPCLGQGIGAGEVRLMQAGQLTALVSDIPPGPVAQTRRNMVAHTSVLERAISRTDILPLRFGTVATDPAAFSRCIGTHDGKFRQAFRDIAGRVELGVKASWREGVVFSDIIAADEELCRMRDRLRRLPATETYYERVELGRRVEAALDRHRMVETAAIVAELAPLVEREAELHNLDNDMILNRAFLVRRENEKLFDARMQAVAERCSDRVNFRYVGPVPPYNFVRLQVSWLGGAA